MAAFQSAMACLTEPIGVGKEELREEDCRAASGMSLGMESDSMPFVRRARMVKGLVTTYRDAGTESLRVKFCSLWQSALEGESERQLGAP